MKKDGPHELLIPSIVFDFQELVRDISAGSYELGIGLTGLIRMS